MNEDTRARLLGHLASLSGPLHFAVSELSADETPALAPRERMSEEERSLMLADVDRLFPPSAVARAYIEARQNSTHPAIRALIQFQNSMRR